jgi:hypothetical protein
MQTGDCLALAPFVETATFAATFFARLDQQPLRGRDIAFHPRQCGPEFGGDLVEPRLRRGEWDDRHPPIHHTASPSVCFVANKESELFSSTKASVGERVEDRQRVLWRTLEILLVLILRRVSAQEPPPRLGRTLDLAVFSTSVANRSRHARLSHSAITLPVAGSRPACVKDGWPKSCLGRSGRVVRC